MKCKYCQKTIVDDSVFCSYCGKKQIIERVDHKRANGEGTIYKRNGSWTAKHTAWRNGQCITHSHGGFDTKREAAQWLKENTAVNTKKKEDKLTFKQLYEMWNAVHYPTISYKKTVAYKASYNTMQQLHNLYYEEITLNDMQKAVECAKNSYGQRRLCKNVLHMMEDFANRNGYQERHITQYIVLPPKIAPQKHPFTIEEITKLEDAWKKNDAFAGIILIMIYTGMRFCEIKQLDPKNIHLDEGYLIGGQKTEAGRQGEIIIIDSLKPMMKMFSDTNPINYSDTTFMKKFNACLARNGLSEHTPHECRHTFATLLVNSGTQSLTLQQLMRHTSVSQTQTYVHQSRDDLKHAIEKIKKTTQKSGRKKKSAGV